MARRQYEVIRSAGSTAATPNATTAASASVASETASAGTNAAIGSVSNSPFYREPNMIGNADGLVDNGEGVQSFDSTDLLNLNREQSQGKKCYFDD